MADIDGVPGLDPDTTPVDLPDEGQGSQKAVDYFFSTKIPGDEGDEDLHFKDPDELTNWMKENYLRRSDYTKKTQAIADDRRQYDADRVILAQQMTDLDSRRKSLEDLEKRLNEMNNFLGQNPAIYREIEQKMREMKDRGGINGQDVSEIIERMFEEKYGPRIQQFESKMREQETAERRSAVLAKLKEQYPDFDEKSIDEEFNKLKEAGDMGALYEILYHSLRGRNADPVKIEQGVLEKIEKNKKAGITPVKGSSPGSTPKSVGSIDSIKEELKKGL